MVQMNDPSNFTGDTMRKLEDSVDRAYDCATKEPSSGHPSGAGLFRAAWRHATTEVKPKKIGRA